MKKLLAIFTLIIIGYLTYSCGLSEDTVAKVGKKTITLDDYKFVLQRRFPQKPLAKIDSSQRMSILNYMIKKYLQANDAIDLKLDTTRIYQTELAEYTARLIGNKYFERVIVDKMISEDQLRKNFEQQREEVKARHILISYKGARGSKSDRTKEEALKLAQKIAKEAKTGKLSFNYLAEKYSDDPSAKTNKGDLGYFTWGQMVDPFQKVAFALKPGQISEPVETVYGYHIIKVEDHRKNPFFDENNYEQQKMEIKRNLYFAKQDSGRKLWEEHKKELKKKYAATILKENVEKVANIAKEKQNSGYYKPKNYSNKEKNIVLATWSNGKLTLDDLFLLYGGRRFEFIRKRLTDPKKFEKVVDQVLLQKLVEQEARRLGIFDEFEVRTDLKDFQIQKLSALALRKEVKEKVKPTKEEVRKYYEEHQKEFVKPAEIEIWEIYVKDKKKAEKVLALAKRGYNFERLAEKYTEDKYYQKKKGYLGFKSKNRRGAVSKKAFEIGENQVAGPIKYRTGYVVIKTGKMHPETIRSFEEAYNQAKAKLRNKQLKDRREQWEQELKDRYSVKINYKVVENLQ
ncbi:MAG: hypothetical protein GXO77_03360 [Calditrichaeota bacterium]|nr:hypothetical protein [Calditrichota bacterium]